MTPTPDLHISLAAAALPTEIDQGAHQTPTANPPMRIANDARAKLTSALRRQQGTAMATTEGGAPQTTNPVGATHLRNLAAQALMPTLFSLLQRCQETETR